MDWFDLKKKKKKKNDDKVWDMCWSFVSDCFNIILRHFYGEFDRKCIPNTFCDADSYLMT